MNAQVTPLHVESGSAVLSGGTFTSGGISCTDGPVSSLLAPGYAYKKNGAWCSLENMESTSLSGSVTVEKAPVQITAQPQDTSTTYEKASTLSIAVQSEGTVTYAWYLDGEADTNAAGGTFTPSGLTVGEHTVYCVVTCDGCPVKSETATVTVGPCTHEGVSDCQPNNNGTHTLTCSACGYTGTAEPCGFTQTAAPTETQHIGQCPDCGGEQTGEHTFGEWNSGVRQCTVCGYEQTAAAKVVLSGNTTYVDDLQAAFGMSSGGFDTTTVTLLRDVALADCVNVASGFFALNLNGHTITGGDTAFSVDSGIFTIKNTETAGGITASGDAIEVSGGGVTLDDGCACSSTGGGCGISVTGGTVNVIGKNVVIKRLSVTGGKLQVSGESAEIEELSVSGSGSAVLFSGTYKGAPAIQTTSGTLKDLQYSRPDRNEYYAYFLNGKPIDLTTLQSQTELNGTITVKKCTHEGVSGYTPNNNGTHTLACRACGFTGTEEKCGYIFEGNVGTCQSCKSALTVSVSGTENLIYDGTGKEPGVTVMRDGTPLAAGNDYTVAHSNNVNAGTAAVTVTGVGLDFSYTQNFTIAKATPAITWANTTQELTYTGQPAAITAPSVTLVNSETFNGKVNYSYAVNGSSSYTSGLPTNAGTYTIKASIAENGNYTAATTEMPLTLTINKSQPTIAFASDYDPSKTYDGQIIANPTASDLTITGADYKDVTFTWSATPKDAGTYTLTASIAETNNTESATATKDVTINKASLTADNATVQTKPYDGSDTAIITGVTFSGLANGETLTLGTDYTATGTFDSADAGTDKSVTVTVTLTGTAKANNYALSGTTFTAKGTIEKATPTVTNVTVSSPATLYESTDIGNITLTHGADDTAGTVTLVSGQTLTVGIKSYDWTFTPDDTNNYNPSPGGFP